MISTFPRLFSAGHEISTEAEVFGELCRSDDIWNDGEALQERMAQDGYLYLPGLLNREEVLEVRRATLEKLARKGHIDSKFDLLEAVAAPGCAVEFEPDLAQDNPALLDLLYGTGMMGFYERFLGGPVRHFDYTWMRAVAPGKGTRPHCDIVFMGRGTPRLFTAWTPLGDVPLEVGGLMVLENSHLRSDVREDYGRKDVDVVCSNRTPEEGQSQGGKGWGGWISTDPAELRARLGGRWLTTEFRLGDVLTFSMFTVHGSLDNGSNQIRLSSDSRYQLASEPADQRWIGPNPLGHGPQAKIGMIC